MVIRTRRTYGAGVPIVGSCYRVPTVVQYCTGSLHLFWFDVASKPADAVDLCRFWEKQNVVLALGMLFIVA